MNELEWTVFWVGMGVFVIGIGVICFKNRGHPIPDEDLEE